MAAKNPAPENKAAPAPDETADTTNVLTAAAANPVTADGEKLSAADTKRQQELARSGYLLPAEQFAAGKEIEKREAKIAANMPSTDGSKPHEP